MRHEKALDSEWEGTEHDKRKEEKDMTNIRQKEKKSGRASEPRERGREERQNEPGWRFLGEKYLFAYKIY